MLKKYIKSFIIVLIQFIPPAILVVLIAQFLIQHPETAAHVRHFFIHFKGAFLLSHVVFYIGLFFLWPKVVLLISKRQNLEPTPEQLSKANQIRLYLIAILIFIELLNVVR